MPTVAEQYVEALKHLENMYALWSPKPNTVLRPGCCGYFDDQGSWNPVVDLNIKDEAARFNFPTVLPKPMEEALGKWDPTCSENVEWSRVALATPIKIPQLGVELKMKLEFSKDDEYGACLVTGPTVVNKYFPNPIQLFESWFKDNYRTIVKANLDLRDHDLWIINKVYETPRCAVAGWGGSAGSLSLYAGAGSLFGGAITLEGTIASGHRNNAALWKFLPPEDTTSSTSDGVWNFFTGNRFKNNSDKQIPAYVVFVGAHRYKRRIPPFPGRLVPVGRGEEGEDNLMEVVDSDGEKVWLEREDWGQ